MNTKTKTKRNTRISLLRDSGMSWRKIAEHIASEFPEDAVSHQRCKEIYDREVLGIRPASEERRRKAGKS